MLDIYNLSTNENQILIKLLIVNSYFFYQYIALIINYTKYITYSFNKL